MKNIFAYIGLLIPFCGLSQTKYPKYEISGKDTTGICLSIEQSKRIKKDLELKNLYETMAISCDCTLNKFVNIIDDYEINKKYLNNTINKLDSLNKNQKEELNTTSQKLKLEERNRILCDSQSIGKDTIINNQSKVIRKYKFERDLGLWGSGLFFSATIILSIILALH